MADKTVVNVPKSDSNVLTPTAPAFETKAPVTNSPAPTTQDAFNANQAKFDAMNPVWTSVAELAKPVAPSQQLQQSPDNVAPAMREWTAPSAPTQTNLSSAVAKPVSAPPVKPEVSQFAGTKEQIAANKAAFQSAQASVPKNAEVPVSAEARASEITKHLNEGYANAPELFQNRQAFENAYSYKSKPTNEQAQLDAFWNSKLPKSSDDLFRSYASGAPKQFSDTKEWLEASHRLELASPYKNADENALYSGMVSGSIVPGSKAYDDVMAVNGGETAAMLAAKKRYDQKIETDRINRSYGLSGEGMKGTKSETPDPIAKASDAFVSRNGMDYAKEFKAAISDDPEINALVKETNANKAEISKLEEEKRRKVQEIVDNNPGISAGMALSLAQRQIRPIDDQLSALYRKQDTASSNLQYKTGLAEKMFGYKVQQYQEQSQKQSQIEAENRSFERSKQLAQFQSDLNVSAKQKEFEQQMAQKAAVAKDPVLATQDLLDQYSKLGIVPQRSSAEIVADVQAQVKAGKPLGQALSELNQAFQSKSEYKNYLATKFPGQDSGFKLQNVTMTDADGNTVTRTVQYNEKTGEMREIWANQPWTSASDAATFGGNFQDLTSTLKRTGNNVGKDTNNPGNIMAENEKQIEYAKSLGAVGTYTSPNGRTYAVFPDMATGKAATVADVKTKLAGGSSWATPDTTLGKFASGWTSWPNAKYNSGAAANYARLTGFSENTRIKDIPVETLVGAIMANEGVDPNQSADIRSAVRASVPEFAQNFLGALQRGEFTTSGGGVSPKWADVLSKYTDGQMNIMNSIDPKSVTAIDTKTLRKAKLTVQDVVDYKAAKNANKWTSGLEDADIKRISWYVDDLNSDQTTKTFKKGQEAYNFAIKAKNGTGSTDNQALIYAFAKAMDPDSVVREGEYATVQKYSQTWGDKLGMDINRVLNGKEFISPQAKEDILNTIKTKFKSQQEAYQALRNNKIRLINDIAGKDIGERVIPDESFINSTEEKPQASISKATYDNLVSKFGQSKADAYVKQKGFTVTQ